MKKFLPLLLLFPFAAYALIQAQASLAPNSSEYTLCSSSEVKFWGGFAAIVIATVIVMASLWTKVKEWVTGSFGRHTLLVTGLLVIVVVGSHVVGTEGCRESRAWSRTLDPNLEETTDPQEQLKIAVKLSDGTEQRLRDQYSEIRGRARHHLRVMAYFFANYYRAIQLMALLGAIAAVALFFVAFTGWTSSNQYVRNLFITSTVLTAYFSLYPTVFKQQDNITDNKNLYLQYVALENRVRTFAATGQSPVAADGTTKLTEADFLRDIDQRMEALNNIAIGFDYTKVSYKDVFSGAQPKPAGGVPASQQQAAAPAEGADKKKAADNKQ